ncbi:MAG: hypothetical protein JXR77_06335 [Lentisphaeria bacterium]|nr:hypothetical protein [Lentisphaeria bacterium]
MMDDVLTRMLATEKEAAAILAAAEKEAERIREEGRRRAAAEGERLRRESDEAAAAVVSEAVDRAHRDEESALAAADARLAERARALAAVVRGRAGLVRDAVAYAAAGAASPGEAACG